MNREQRRAQARGRLLEAYPDGTSFAAQDGLLGVVRRSRQAAGFPAVKRIRTHVTDQGDVVPLCPWCDAELRVSMVPGAEWDCSTCGAWGLFAPAPS